MSPATQHQSSNPHWLIKNYLVLYNFLQAAGWTLCLGAVALKAAEGADYQTMFLAGSVYARWMQFAAFAEILHAGTGLVPSNPISNFWQWLGRANALFKFAVGITELQHSICPVVMLVCWSLGEIIRYPWYGLTLLNACPYWLTWLRYSTFLVLYPVGVVSEMLLLYWGVPIVRERRLYSIFMPNSWNFAWDYALFIQIMLVLYPYLWWGNFSTLLRQRKRKIMPVGHHHVPAAADPAAAASTTTKKHA